MGIQVRWATGTTPPSAVGRALEALETAGLADETVVVFTADHGFPFPLAKMSLYDAGIEVPLLLRIPGLEGGRGYSEFVTHVDFVPTVLDMLGIEKSQNLQGSSYWSLLRGEPYMPSVRPISAG